MHCKCWAWAEEITECHVYSKIASGLQILCTYSRLIQGLTWPICTYIHTHTWLPWPICTYIHTHTWLPWPICTYIHTHTWLPWPICTYLHIIHTWLCCSICAYIHIIHTHTYMTVLFHMRIHTHNTYTHIHDCATTTRREIHCTQSLFALPLPPPTIWSQIEIVSYKDWASKTSEHTHRVSCSVFSSILKHIQQLLWSLRAATQPCHATPGHIS